ncbi:MAG: response regulator [Terriglobales bacterium]
MSRVYQGSGKMLLCIDDSRAILEYEKTLFETSGYIVITAESPQQGLKLARMTSFDAVLLDYQMPGMNGHQLAMEIRRLRPDTPIIMFSGSELIPEETLELVDAALPKTEEINELLSTVARLWNQTSPA